MKWNSSTSSAKGASLSSNRVGHVKQTVACVDLLWPAFSLSRAALVEYTSISGKTLEESIESEMSGELESLLLAIGGSEWTRNIRQQKQNWKMWQTEPTREFYLTSAVLSQSSVWTVFLPTLQSSCIKAWRWIVSILAGPSEAMVAVFYKYKLVLLSGLRNRRVDSEQNHGDPVWAGPAGHQGGVQEAVWVLAAQRHQGEWAFDWPGDGGGLWAAASTVLTRVSRMEAAEWFCDVDNMKLDLDSGCFKYLRGSA